MDLTHQNFFLQHLQALAQNETLHTAEEIRAAAEGLKLLDRNVRLESEDLQKLAQIPLERPIYENIRFMEPLTLPAIRLHMQKAMAQSPGLQLFQRATRAPQVALDCLNQVTLPPPLLNILTVMSRQLPELYAHTLEVALISTFLGILHRMDRSELVHVMSAGLFHDIGSMFLPPSLLDRETTLSWSDWRLIYTHPSIGHDILKGVKGVPPQVMAAVHQHHERVDGSGYPQGLVDQDIGQLGRISAAAEVVAGVTQHKSKHYLTTVLNANIGRLDRTVLETLTEVLANVSSDDFSQVSDNAATFRLVDTVSDALARWQSLDLQVRSHRDLEKVSGGIAAAQRIVNASGLSTDSLALSDADSMAFVKLSQHTADAFQEAKYQLGQVLHDVHRNKASYMAIDPPEASKAFGRWVAETDRRLKEIADPVETLSEAKAPPSSPEHEPQWYYLKAGKKCGPVSPVTIHEYLEQGELQPDDLAWRAGLDNWCILREVEDLITWDIKHAEQGRAG
ncbi:HD domain-containing phosphohydrolase [Methylogaea oryzae]|uniref:HD domain-containing phosphohydrolase n=1 Tax=Methylogaea oryzae TaxID=1295382 RepID=UPI001C7FB8D3|nr:HD domain-containing phosphohydrolase [Methylogaea oryzae]